MPSNFVAKGADGYEAIMGRWSRRLADQSIDPSGGIALLRTPQAIVSGLAEIRN
jgi:hypothetical protein